MSPLQNQPEDLPLVQAHPLPDNVVVSVNNTRNFMMKGTVYPAQTEPRFYSTSRGYLHMWRSNLSMITASGRYEHDHHLSTAHPDTYSPPINLVLVF